MSACMGAWMIACVWSHASIGAHHQESTRTGKHACSMLLLVSTDMSRENLLLSAGHRAH